MNYNFPNLNPFYAEDGDSTFLWNVDTHPALLRKSQMIEYSLNFLLVISNIQKAEADTGLNQCD
jgi:hypothetical protein